MEVRRKGNCCSPDAYSSKANGGPPPFPPHEIWLPSSIMFVHHDFHINRSR